MNRDELTRYAQRSRVHFLKTPLDALTMAETLEIIELAIQNGIPLQHTVVNVAKLVKMRSDPVLRDAVSRSDLINVDGAGIVIGAGVLGIQIPERIAGIDLMLNVIQSAERKSWGIFILGSKQSVLDRAVQNLRIQFPSLRICGFHHGYFSESEEQNILRQVAACAPDCLFVAMPSPAKERLIDRWRPSLTTPFMMGVGGSIDVIAGTIRRAPMAVQRVGLEWAFRMVQEPIRMGPRYLRTNSAYAWLLCQALLTKRRG